MTIMWPLLLAFRFSLGPAALPAAPVAAPPQPGTAVSMDTTVTVDRWFAEDKLRHFFLSFAATSMAYGAVRTIGVDGAPAQIAAAVAGGGVGLWKEWHDYREGRPFSTKDLAWDALGVGVGLVLTTRTR